MFIWPISPAFVRSTRHPVPGKGAYRMKLSNDFLWDRALDTLLVSVSSILLDFFCWINHLKPCFRFLTGAIIFSGLVQLELCSTWLNSFNQGIPSKTLCLKLFLLIWPQFAQYCSILFQLEFRKSKSLEKCTFYGACSISDMKKSKQTLPVILPFLQFPSSLP